MSEAKPYTVLEAEFLSAWADTPNASCPNVDRVHATAAALAEQSAKSKKLWSMLSKLTALAWGGGSHHVYVAVTEARALLAETEDGL